MLGKDSNVYGWTCFNKILILTDSPLFILHPWPYFCWLLFNICYFSELMTWLLRASFEAMKFCVLTWGRSAFRSLTRPRQKWNAILVGDLMGEMMDYSMAFRHFCGQTATQWEEPEKPEVHGQQSKATASTESERGRWKDPGEMIARFSKEIERTFAAGKRILSFQPHL